jgi:hypothetical protein
MVSDDRVLLWGNSGYAGSRGRESDNESHMAAGVTEDCIAIPQFSGSHCTSYRRRDGVARKI